MALTSPVTGYSGSSAPSPLPPPADRPPLSAVKICGVASAADAAVATAAAAATLPPGVELLVGMIAHPPSPRHVEPPVAAAIAAAARAGGATPVVVFVAQDAAEVAAYLTTAGVTTAQLHGPRAAAARADLPPWVRVIRVVHVAPDGGYEPPSPSLSPQAPQLSSRPGATAAVAPAAADLWTVYDAGSGGGGVAFDWAAFVPPSDGRWLLAGGLHPGNVAAALAAVSPGGVDVSSGVCGPGGVVKDPARVTAFLEAVVVARAQKLGGSS